MLKYNKRTKNADIRKASWRLNV